jgi:cell division transport system ATP-binding protein
LKGAARVIRFESVSLSYRGGGERSVAPDVLRDVNLDLAEGTFHWLLGASGSGKTTLLRLMNMSLRPTRGTVSVL